MRKILKESLSCPMGAALVALCLSVSGTAAAAVPPAIGYQGRLYDANGQPVNGSLSVVFALYPTTASTSAVWTETQTVTFTNGYFTVQLGSVTPFKTSAFDGTVRFLGVTVGSDAEMTPRATIASVPYALSAGPDTRFGTNTGLAVAGAGATCTLGEVILSAGSIATGVPAAGQLLQISQNAALFSLFGTAYGGDGTTTFGVPDLRSAAPNGLTYSICTAGVFPAKS